VLTCTSDQSRNFRHGRALGAGQPTETGVTVEGVATAKAVSNLARTVGIETPITDMVAAFCDGLITLPEAIKTLLSRPLKEE
jgi:glycerol-3-phosphate dehydrogenase (NAD(P)+)